MEYKFTGTQPDDEYDHDDHNGLDQNGEDVYQQEQEAAEEIESDNS